MNRKSRKHRKPIVSVKSSRFCINCNKIRQFKYNGTVCHSECSICGFRYGIKKDFLEEVEEQVPKEEIKIEEVKESPKQIPMLTEKDYINKLHADIGKLNTIINNQRKELNSYKEKERKQHEQKSTGNNEQLPTQI